MKVANLHEPEVTPVHGRCVPVMKLFQFECLVGVGVSENLTNTCVVSRNTMSKCDLQVARC